MYDYLLGMIESFVKYGMSPTAFIMAIIALFRTKHFKRFFGRYMPMFFRDETDVLYYQARQIRIEQKLDALAKHMGVDPACPDNVVTSRTSSDSANGRRASYLYSWAELWRVPAAAPGEMSLFMNLKKRRMMKMKKWFRPDSLTAFGAVIIAAVNRYFGFEIDPANLIAAAVLLIGYFKAQELVTVVRDANGLPSGFRLNSRKLIFTMVAFLCVVLDELFKLGLSTEILLAVAAGVTGVNYLEANKDVKQAEAEAEEARQTY